jgi:LysM repeat protein
MQDAKAFAFAKSPAKSANLTKTPASGVGDEAVFNTIGSVTATLTVKKGDTYFEVHVYGFGVEQTQMIEKTLAQAIVAKL